MVLIKYMFFSLCLSRIQEKGI